MKSNPPRQPPGAAWFLIGYLVHIADEWTTGVGFPAWLSNAAGVAFTPREFLVLNGVGIAVVTVAVAAASRGVTVARVALATATGTNALLHLGTTVGTDSLVPGTMSATILWLPLAVITLVRLRRIATSRQVAAGIAIGIAGHAVVTWIALGGP